MNAALMDNGRHRNAATVAEAQANGQLRPVTGVKVFTTNHDARTEQERRTELDTEAERLEVSRRFFL